WSTRWFGLGQAAGAATARWPLRGVSPRGGRAAGDKPRLGIYTTSRYSAVGRGVAPVPPGTGPRPPPPRYRVKRRHHFRYMASLMSPSRPERPRSPAAAAGETQRPSSAVGHPTCVVQTDLGWPVRSSGWLALDAIFLARAPASASATLPTIARAAGPGSGASPIAEGAAIVRLERAPPDRGCSACSQRPRTAVTEGHQDRRARWRRGQVPVARRGVRVDLEH